MSDYIEALVTLLPRDAGGRLGVVAPREGSYRPFARLVGEDALLRIRIIEGPPRLAPGETGRVVAEAESAINFPLPPGTELDLVELDARTVGVMTVTRVWRVGTLIA